ncbi:MAG: antitoxin [Solirubrobacteraceae bacterium]
MRTTLDIADDVMVAARELARAEGTSIGAVVSDLARRGLAPGRVEREHGRPIIRSPAGAPPITPEIVRRALDED